MRSERRYFGAGPQTTGTRARTQPAQLPQPNKTAFRACKRRATKNKLICSEGLGEARADGAPPCPAVRCWGLFPVARGSWAGCVRARVPVVCGPSPKFLRTERIRGPPRCRQTFLCASFGFLCRHLSCRPCQSRLVCQRRARRTQRIFLPVFVSSLVSGLRFLRPARF